VRARARVLLGAPARRAGLFEAIEAAPSPLAKPAGRARSPLRAGDDVGPYHLVEVLGSGGFGTVFLAEQTEPVHRRVALKMLHEGLLSASARTRFEAERQVLARMEHPGIARVFDADTTPSGVPYFAMEFVDGEPITTYCDAAGLGLRARIQLVGSVCRAVAHAHQRGVVHRDLKPSNVLVLEVDGVAQAKVIDFGVAKILDDFGGARSDLSIAGEMLGTPSSMSPEQVAGELDLDTRADVYSLGVLMYELIAGAPPFDVQELGIAGLLHAVLETEPESPGRRRRRAAGDESTGAGRVPSDLDWIVMRCLEKDRARRYPSAIALAADLQRFLDRRPVEAAPPSTWYRARTLVRRHRAVTIAAGAVFLSLVVGGVGTVLGLVRAREERDVARTVLDFVRSDLLAATVPSDRPDRGKDVLLLDVVNDAARRLEAGETGVAASGSPRAIAAIHSMLADLYDFLGRYEESALHAERALESFSRAGEGDSHDAMRTASRRAGTLGRLGQLDESTEILRGIAERQDGTTLDAREERVYTLVRLAYAEKAAGEFPASIAAAETALAEARAFDAPHWSMLSIVHTALGVVYASDQQVERAGRHFEQAYELDRGGLGEEHPRTLTGLGNVASNLLARGEHEEAAERLEECILLASPSLGADHPDLLKLRRNLGMALLGAGRTDDARDVLVSTLGDAVARLGEQHDECLALRACLSEVALAVGDTGAAVSKIRSAYEETLRSSGPDAAATQHRRRALLDILFTADAPIDELMSVADADVASSERTFGAEHLTTLRARANRALVLNRAERWQESEAEYRATIEAFDRSRGRVDAETIETRGALADLLLELDRIDEAEALGRELVEDAHGLPADDLESRGRAAARLGFALVAKGEVEEAIEVLGDAEALLADSVGEDDVWTRYVRQVVSDVRADRSR
ncbi:MAG: serine/threonine-protein kinase, partial [Planctomycetota bacterium]